MSSLSDQAYKSLKSIIIDAEPGTFFSVRKSATELGFSYTPTREALLRLHSEGLLNLVPNVGFFTVQLDMRTIVNIYQSRECVEQYVLPMVIEQITEEDITVLRKNIEIQTKAMVEKDITNYTEVDAEFHCYIIDLLKNKQISDFYRSIRSQYRIGTQKIVKSHSMIPIEEHISFLNMIEAKEYEKAIEAYHLHTRAAIERLRDGFVRIGF